MGLGNETTPTEDLMAPDACACAQSAIEKSEPVQA
jgi:hypothetical protein